MNRWIFLISLCLMPVAAFAQPTTQHGKPNRPGPQMMKRPTSRPFEDPQEFGNALNFLERWSPNRFKAYQSLDDDRKGIFRERIVAFYRVNQFLLRGDDNDDMKKLREKLIKAEDDVFGIRWEILVAGGPRRASDEDKAKLREAVADLVKIQLDERKLRLDRMKENVKSEEEKLAAINANPDQYIDQRYKDELEGRGLGLFDHPRRQEGPGGRGPGGVNGPNANKPDGGGQKGNEKSPPK